MTLLVGGQLVRNVWLSTATRYLDGQPFTGVDVVEALPQGPAAVMVTQRGTPGPRHTFHMTTDARLSYLWRGRGQHTLSLVLDAFNLLGSGTEIVEDPRAGRETFRRALEMIARDVDGGISCQRVHRVEQQPNLYAVAAAELDQMAVGTHQAGDVAGYPP